MRTIIKLMITTVFLLIAQMALATSQMTVCPSTEMLKAFKKGKHIAMRRVELLSIDVGTGVGKVALVRGGNFINQDSVLAGYGRLVFVLSGLTVESLGKNPDELLDDKSIEQVLDRMKVDSVMPVQFDGSMPMCAYSLPGEEIKGIVFQVMFPDNSKLPDGLKPVN